MHTHNSVNLDDYTCPSKEQRLGSINAYHGNVSELFKENDKGSLPLHHRKFQQTENCLLMQTANRILSIRDATVIVHGPIGCSRPLSGYREIFLNIPESLGRPHHVDLNWLSTNLTENDVVFGGVEKLKAAILEAERRYSPKAIFVITTCTSGVIGDDIEGTVNSVKDQVGATIVPIHCESFRSQVSQTAFDAMAHGVVKYLVKSPGKIQKDLVAIPAPFSFTWRDRIETNRLLGKLGLRVVYIPDFATVEDLERLSEAAVVAPTCRSYGDYWQRALHEKYDVPYFRGPIPIGIKNTQEWLRQIAKFTSKEKEVEVVIKEELEAIEPELKALKDRLKDKDASILVSAGQPRITFTPRLAHELGIKVKAVQALELDPIMVDELKDVYEDIGEFEIHVSNWQPFELAHMDDRLKPGLHTACPMMGLFRRSGGIVRNHSFRSDFSDPAGQLGFRGIINYGYLLLRALNNPSMCNGLNRNVKKPYKDWWYKQKDMFHYTKETGDRVTHGPGIRPEDIKHKAIGEVI